MPCSVGEVIISFYVSDGVAGTVGPRAMPGMSPVSLAPTDSLVTVCWLMAVSQVSHHITQLD